MLAAKGRQAALEQYSGPLTEMDRSALSEIRI